MEIVAAQSTDLDTVKTWFSDAQAAYYWGGPALRFPFEAQSFLHDIRWGEINSCVCRDGNGVVLGFGQFYEKAGRCHLARLALAPSQRGQGLGKRFVAALMQTAMATLQLNACSLYVATANTAALRSYQALGFVSAPNPAGEAPMPGVEFMVYATS